MDSGFFHLSSYHYAFAAWPPAIVGFCILALSLVVIIRERATRVSRAFTYFCLSVGGWLLSTAALYSALSIFTSNSWAHIQVAFVAFIPTTMLYFTLTITKRIARWRFVVPFLFVLSAGFAASALLGSSFVAGLRQYPWGLYPQYAHVGSVFLAYFALTAALSLRMMWTGFRPLPRGIRRLQLRSFFITFSVGLLGAVDFLACYNIVVYPVGYLPVYAAILMLAQVIWQYRFTDITPALAAPQIMATMPDPLIVLDAQGVVSLVNQAACRLFQQPEVSLLGSSINSLIGATTTDDMFRLLGDANAFSDFESEVRLRSGATITTLLSASALRSVDRQPMAYVCVLRDISNRKAREAALRESEERFRSVAQCAPDAIITTDPKGQVAFWNKAAERIFGYSEAEMSGQSLNTLLSPRHQIDGKHGLQILQGDYPPGPAGRPLQLYGRRQDGTEFPFELSLSTWESQGQGFWTAIVRDVTERTMIDDALRRSESRLRRLVDANIVGFVMQDSQGQVIEANDAFLKMVGYDRSELDAGEIGEHVLCPEEYKTVDQWMTERLAQEGRCPPVEREFVRKDGSRVPALVGSVRLEDVFDHRLWFVIDVSERRAAQEALKRAYDELEIFLQERTKDLREEIARRERAEDALRAQAVTDAMTGLYNRRGFRSFGENRLTLASRERKSLLLFMMDLDGLKGVNDTYGHVEGDEAIVRIATILRSVCRASDIVARIGGDEFALLAMEDAGFRPDKLIARIKEKIETYNQSSGKPYELGLSVGFARSTKDRETLEQLMIAADAELYIKKRQRHARKTK